MHVCMKWKCRTLCYRNNMQCPRYIPRRDLSDCKSMHYQLRWKLITTVPLIVYPFHSPIGAHLFHSYRGAHSLHSPSGAHQVHSLTGKHQLHYHLSMTIYPLPIFHLICLSILAIEECIRYKILKCMKLCMRFWRVILFSGVYSVYYLSLLPQLLL